MIPAKAPSPAVTPAPPPTPKPAEPAPEVSPPSHAVPLTEKGRIYASPMARRLAEKKNIRLEVSRITFDMWKPLVLIFLKTTLD